MSTTVATALTLLFAAVIFAATGAYAVPRRAGRKSGTFASASAAA